MSFLPNHPPAFGSMYDQDPFTNALGPNPKQQLQTLQQQIAKIPARRPRARGEPTLNDLNNNPIFSAPREALRDMWRAKFDTVWVSKKDLHAGPEENIFLFQELTGRCGFKVVARQAYCETSGQNVEVFKFEFE